MPSPLSVAQAAQQLAATFRGTRPIDAHVREAAAVAVEGLLGLGDCEGEKARHYAVKLICNQGRDGLTAPAYGDFKAYCRARFTPVPPAVAAAPSVEATVLATTPPHERATTVRPVLAGRAFTVEQAAVAARGGVLACLLGDDFAPARGAPAGGLEPDLPIRLTEEEAVILADWIDSGEILDLPRAQALPRVRRAADALGLEGLRTQLDHDLDSPPLLTSPEQVMLDFHALEDKGEDEDEVLPFRQRVDIGQAMRLPPLGHWLAAEVGRTGRKEVAAALRQVASGSDDFAVGGSDIGTLPPQV